MLPFAMPVLIISRIDGDSEKADEMIAAFKKGFDQATKAWGKSLPDISGRTYDAVMKKFDAWKNGTETAKTETEE